MSNLLKCLEHNFAGPFVRLRTSIWKIWWTNLWLCMIWIPTSGRIWTTFTFTHVALYCVRDFHSFFVLFQSNFRLFWFGFCRLVRAKIKCTTTCCCIPRCVSRCIVGNVKNSTERHKKVSRDACRLRLQRRRRRHRRCRSYRCSYNIQIELHWCLAKLYYFLHVHCTLCSIAHCYMFTFRIHIKVAHLHATNVAECYTMIVVCCLCVCVVESFQLFKSNVENFGWMNTLLNGIAHLNGVHIAGIQWASLCASVPVFTAHSETAKRQMYRIDTVHQCTNTPKNTLALNISQHWIRTDTSLCHCFCCSFRAKYACSRISKWGHFSRPKIRPIFKLNWMFNWTIRSCFSSCFLLLKFHEVFSDYFVHADTKLAGFYSDQAPSHFGEKDVWLFVY